MTRLFSDLRGRGAMFSNCPCATNKDCQVRDHHASLIDENQVCGSGIQRLEQNGAVGPVLNVDDFRVSDQHGFEGPLEQQFGPDTKRESDRPIRGRSNGNRDQQESQPKGACAKQSGHRQSSDDPVRTKVSSVVGWVASNRSTEGETVHNPRFLDDRGPFVTGVIVNAQTVLGTDQYGRARDADRQTQLPSWGSGSSI